MKCTVAAGVLGVLLAADLAGCQTASPTTLDDVSRASDWNLEDGDALAFRFRRDMRRLLGGRDLGDALGDLRAAGYECKGQACVKSFATRACQLEWFVVLLPKNAIVEHVNTDFTRDCVGKDRDWPGTKMTEIDDRLAPAKP